MIASLLLALLAQTHPCDLPPRSSVILSGREAILLFCADPTEWVEGEILVDDPPATVPVTTVTAKQMTGPNVDGLAQYAVSLGVLTLGSHTLIMTVTNKDAAGDTATSDPSDPYSFIVKGVPKPKKPKILEVR